MKIDIKLGLLLFAVLVCAGHPSAQVATGGTYTLAQATIAGGGGSSAGAGYLLGGTTGQAVTADNAAGNPYSLRSGFWNPLSSATAAGVSVSGRVVAENGRGITNAKVTLFGASLSQPRVVLTGRFGTFVFNDVEAGQTYLITVASRRFTFEQSSQLISVVDNVSDIMFTGN